MAKVLRPIGHEERLSVVDHLDELRSRLIVCVAALIVAFGVCFWQNQALLDVLNRALPHVPTSGQEQGLAGVPSQTAMERNAFLSQARADRAQAAAPGLSGAARQELLRAAQGFTKSA